MRTVLIRRFASLAIPLVAAVGLQAQTPLDRYLAEGLEKNIVLQQKNTSLEKALTALQTAKSLYLPAVAFQAGYQTGDGGRDIPLPLGDLLNGVYATLNQLTASQKFPQLENESINFFPRNFYDVKLRTTVPIINTDIGYNKKINQQQLALQEFEVDTYRRELVRTIKSAYFNYLAALQAVNIYQSALELANEGKRVNEKLLESGKGLPAYVLRASSEVEGVRAQIIQAQQQAENARLYFNSLLNREESATIETDFDTAPALLDANTRLQEAAVIQQREELKSVKKYIELNETVVKMNQQFLIPKLNGFLDLGSQSEGFHFNQKTRYYLAGLQLEVPVFSGNRNKYKIRQAQLDLKNASLNQAHATQQLQLSASVARNNLVASWQSYKATVKQLEAVAAYQRLIDKGYRSGTNSYIETVDARNQLTAAQLASAINTYKVLQAAANLERETASYQLKP